MNNMDRKEMMDELARKLKDNRECDECGVDIHKFDDLMKLSDRLELAIKAHEVYLEAMGDDSYKDAILRKSVALNFTLGILRDIKNND